jgi:hypothetical protein
MIDQISSSLEFVKLQVYQPPDMLHAALPATTQGSPL